MAEETRYAALAARLLRQRPTAPEARTSRDVGVSVVAHAITLRKRRRAARLAAGGALLAAAAGLAIWLVWPKSAREAQIAACTGPSCTPAPAGAVAAALPAGRGLARGESLVAPAGQTSTVVLATGTRITLDPGGALECREDAATQRFAVLRGRAQLAVAKLQAGQRFLVETPNAELEVRGTAFSVLVEAATPTCATRTEVEVQEGAVEVRSAGGRLLLHPGERWANACAEGPAVAAAPAPAPAALAPVAAPHRVGSEPVVALDSERPASAPAVAPPAPPIPTNVPVSSLTEQNDLYARAQSASRDGRRDEALAAYARLLTLFPRGQLAETSSVQYVRLLAGRDRAAARDAAKAYLARYPSGVARAEMEALAGVP
jgi:ferric-dicitrate binding protein FerR (iron transport regulator)